MVAFLLLPSVAHADEPAAPPPATAASETSAASHFEAGELAYARGDYLQSAEEFRLAYRGAAHPAALWNQARALHRAREDARAATCYRAYLDTAPVGSSDRDAATRALGELAAKVGRVDIQAEPGTTVVIDGVDAEPFRTVYLAAGDHRLTGRAQDGTLLVTLDVRVEPGAVRAILLARAVPQTKVAPPALATGSAEASKAQAPEPGAKLPQAASPSSLRKLPAWTLVPLGGVTLGAFTAVALTGAATMRAQSRYLDSRTTLDFEAGKSLQTTTNTWVVIGVGLAVLTAAVAAIFVDYGGTPPTAQARIRRRQATVGEGLGQ
jgi:hypothetical protein